MYQRAGNRCVGFVFLSNIKYVAKYVINARSVYLLSRLSKQVSNFSVSFNQQHSKKMNSSSFELQTFERVPLSALSVESRNCLASYLDPTKLLPTSDGYSRDWRGLFQLSRLRNHYASFFSSKMYPTIELINVLEKVRDPITFNDFRCMLETIDRCDVLDDTYELFVSGAREYLKKQANCLTADDRISAEKGTPLQQYDAFILFTSKDVEIPTRMMQKIEQFGLKLCVKDGDFLVGLPLTYDAIRLLLTKICDG